MKNINLSIQPSNLDETNDVDETALLYEQAIFDEEISILVQDISEFGSQVISYIAGMVVHRLIKTLKCDTCCGALIAVTVDDKHLRFIKLKDKGGLIFPSNDVVSICKRMEVIMKSSILSKKFQKICDKNFWPNLYHIS